MSVLQGTEFSWRNPAAETTLYVAISVERSRTQRLNDLVFGRESANLRSQFANQSRQAKSTDGDVEFYDSSEGFMTVATSYENVAVVPLVDAASDACQAS